MTRTIYFIADPEIDPVIIAADGMSAAFVRDANDVVRYGRNITEARALRDEHNQGLDHGEPEFFIVKVTIHRDANGTTSSTQTRTN